MDKFINTWYIVILGIASLYLFANAGRWITSVFFKSWEKLRKQTRQQQAVNDLYDAFDLDQIKDGTTMKVTTKGSLTIMIYRTEK